MQNTPSKPIKLESDNILSLLIKLSIPGIISMFIHALYNVVDSIWIGHLSKEALAALSLAFPVQIILIAVSVGTGIGVTSLISRLIGKGELHKASNAAEHGLVIAVIYGIAGFFVGSFYSRHIISLFTNTPFLIDMGSQYIKIILMGTMAMSVPIISNTILRGEGNTFTPMITMLIGSIINMVLDPFFIFGWGIFPRLEIQGAAIATVLSRIVSGIFVLYILFKGKTLISLNMKYFSLDTRIIKGIYNVGLPTMVMQLIASFMVAAVNTVLGTYTPLAIAAMGIYFRLQSFVFMPVYGLNQGFMPIVGYNYGHKKPERIKKTIVYGCIISFVFSMIGFFIFQVYPSHLVKIFNDDTQLVAIGTHALKTISLLYPVVGFTIIASVTFQAFGKGLKSLLISVLRQIILLLPLVYLFGKIGGLSLIWYAFPAAEWTAFAFIVLWFWHNIKRIEKDLSIDKNH
ncbi:MAG: MATE family efflux transporter [Candidatus Methanofastidiosia archaeon]|jgi:putative MATE family efflux protein